jgi:hypothetical protein
VRGRERGREIKCSSVTLNLLHRPYSLLGPNKKQYEGSGEGKSKRKNNFSVCEELTNIVVREMTSPKASHRLRVLVLRGRNWQGARIT